MGTKCFWIVFAAASLALFAEVELIFAQDSGKEQVHIDVPVKLEKANVVI